MNTKTRIVLHKDKKRNILDIFNKYASIIILALLVIIFSLATESFLTLNNIFNLIRQISILAILACGATFVLIIGEFDISIGALMSLATCITCGLILKGYPIYIAILIALIIGGIGGCINGLLVTKLKINAFITTLATLYIIRGVTNIYTGGALIALMGTPLFFKIGRGFLWIIPIPVIIMIVVFIIGQILLSKTKVGRIIYAVGGNRIAARFTGIDTDFYKILAFSIGGITAGIAGVVLGSRLGLVDASVGIGYEFNAIIAVVLGGTPLLGGKGSINKTLLGALIMGTLKNGMNLLLMSTQSQMIITAIVFVFAVALSQKGKEQV